MNGPVSLGFETDSFDSSNTPNSKLKELWMDKNMNSYIPNE